MKNQTLYEARNDMQAMVRQAQDYFKQASEATGDKANALINKGMLSLDDALDKGQRIKSSAVDAGQKAVNCTDEYVNDNPWRSIAIAAGVGVLAGFCISRS
jgi:ElaB/YqjD/DUF883 family membrane-anchored ribosome-binding protein